MTNHIIGTELNSKCIYTVKTLITDTLITAKFFIMSLVFAQTYQFSLNLSSLQQKFSLTSNYLGTSSFVVKRVDCTEELFHRVPENKNI